MCSELQLVGFPHGPMDVIVAHAASASGPGCRGFVTQIFIFHVVPEFVF